MSAVPAPNKLDKGYLLDDFDIQRTLGCGSFGRVKLGTLKRNRVEQILKQNNSNADASSCKWDFAIKYMKKHEIIKLKQVDHINSERTLMSQIAHPFIVNMVHSFKDDRFVYIVMEIIEGGELFTHLRKARKFSDEVSKFYGLQVAAAFAHIHSHNIIHRDLKPENLLLDPKGYSKLTDFGFAKVVEPGSRTYTLCGTPEYIAPEVLLNKGHGKPVDWWTLGILIYEMVVGQPPFMDEEPMGIYQKILAGKVYFPKYFDKNAKALVKKLLTADLSKRYGNLKGGSNDILDHKWFQAITLKDLEQFKYVSPYTVTMGAKGDYSNFEQIPESTDVPPAVIGSNDPFNW